MSGRDFYPPATTLAELIAKLQEFNVSVTDADKYLALASTSPTQVGYDAGELLSLTPEELQQKSTELANAEATNREMVAAHDRLLANLEQTMRDSMRAEADGYLDALRPTFDAIATKVNKLYNAGFNGRVPEWTPEHEVRVKGDIRTMRLNTPGTAPGTYLLIAAHEADVTHFSKPADADLVAEECGDEAGKLWDDLTSSGAFSTLAKIAQIRFDLAGLLGVGEGPDGDRSVGLAKLAPANFIEHRRDEHEHELWFRASGRIALIPFRDTKAAA